MHCDFGDFWDCYQSILFNAVESVLSMHHMQCKPDIYFF